MTENPLAARRTARRLHDESHPKNHSPRRYPDELRSRNRRARKGQFVFRGAVSAQPFAKKWFAQFLKFSGAAISRGTLQRCVQFAENVVHPLDLRRMMRSTRRSIMPIGRPPPTQGTFPSAVDAWTGMWTCSSPEAEIYSQALRLLTPPAVNRAHLLCSTS